METTTTADRHATQDHLARHERELDVLSSIGQLLATQAGQREMLADVLRELERHLGMIRCTIMLLSTDGRELVVEAARSFQPAEGHDTRYRWGEGITGTVVQTGRPAIIPRVSREPLFQNRIHRRSRAGDEDISFICVPVMLGSEVVGSLSADFPVEDRDALDEHARVLGIVASLIAFDVKSRRITIREKRVLEAENLHLRSELEERFRPENIVGNSRAMQQVYERIHQVSKSDTTVVIRGESGTGKELVASAIHYNSRRSKKPFVRVNCASLSEGLLESELFGHDKGSFTGAAQDRIGRIEQAEGGTLFFDEIGDFSLSVQVKLLQVLQEHEFERVGGNRVRKADVRVIAATNRDLEDAIAKGDFREDLYYRVNVVPIFMPPLRDRKDDILLLADHFVEKYSQKMAKRVRRISTPAINMMFAYHWPGNVRELENSIEHAVLLADDGVIHAYNLPPSLQMPDAEDSPRATSLQARVKLLEKDMIVDVLKRTHGNMTAAARQLGITPRMIRYKVKNLGIDYRKFFKKEA